jgi:hypothetical protein
MATTICLLNQWNYGKINLFALNEMLDADGLGLELAFKAKCTIVDMERKERKVRKIAQFFGMVKMDRRGKGLLVSGTGRDFMKRRQHKPCTVCVISLEEEKRTNGGLGESNRINKSLYN